jgi:hypothetical protein
LLLAGKPVVLGTVRGYLLAASEEGVTVYNATSLKESRPDLVRRVLHYPLPGSSSPLLFATSASKITSQLPAHTVISVARPEGGPSARSLVILESLLPYARPQPVDFMWIRGPLMVMALVIVFLWQFSKKAGGSGSGSGSGGGGLGRDRRPFDSGDSMDDREFDYLRSAIDSLGQQAGKRPGGGLGTLGGVRRSSAGGSSFRAPGNKGALGGRGLGFDPDWD